MACEARDKVMPHQFLDYFVYESVDTTGSEKVFKNCQLLRTLMDPSQPADVYHVGDIVPAISIQIEFYLWNREGELMDDIPMIHK